MPISDLLSDHHKSPLLKFSKNSTKLGETNVTERKQTLKSLIFKTQKHKKRKRKKIKIKIEENTW